MKRGHLCLTDNWPLVSRPQGAHIGLVMQYVMWRGVGSEPNIMEMLAVASMRGLGTFEWVHPRQFMGNLLTECHAQKGKCLDNNMDHFHHLIASVSLHHIIMWRLICCNDS